MYWHKHRNQSAENTFIEKKTFNFICALKVPKLQAVLNYILL